MIQREFPLPAHSMDCTAVQVHYHHTVRQSDAQQRVVLQRELRAAILHPPDELLPLPQLAQAEECAQQRVHIPSMADPPQWDELPLMLLQAQAAVNAARGYFLLPNVRMICSGLYHARLWHALQPELLHALVQRSG